MGDEDEKRGCGMGVLLVLVLELVLSLEDNGVGETGSGGRSAGLGGDAGLSCCDRGELWSTTPPPRLAIRSSNDGRDFSRRTPNPNIRF